MEALEGGVSLEELRNSIRAGTIGKRVESWLHAEFVMENGVKVDIKRASQSERSRIREAAKVETNGTIHVDFARMSALAIINLVYVPGSNFTMPVYTMKDMATLLDTITGDWFDDLAVAAAEALNVKREDVEKKSEATPNIDSD
jgi:hypothetical protein